MLTVDFFPPVVDDPYNFGSIAAANAMSDIYAMGATPLLALNLVGFPVDLPKEILATILKGGYSKAQEAGCLIIGGHTVDDSEPKFGLAVVGTVKPGSQLSNAGAKPGNKLVLTKPIGTGIITTAAKHGTVDVAVLQVAIDTMNTLNKAAAQAMVTVGVDSCTDVTGFGLMGHLGGMVEASGIGAKVHMSKVPVLPGAFALANKGTVPGGTRRNLDDVNRLTQWHKSIPIEARLLLCDAQTSGGLLIAVPADRLEVLLAELKSAGVPDSRVIGEFLEEGSLGIQVMP